MAQSNSFTLQGATPNQNTKNSASSALNFSPYSKALNSLVGPIGQTVQKTVAHPQVPQNQDVTSHTVTSPDGTTTTQKFAPSSGLLTKGLNKLGSDSAKYVSTGIINKPSATSPAPQSSGTVTSPIPNAPNNGAKPVTSSTGGYINSSGSYVPPTGTETTPSPYKTNYSNLTGQGQGFVDPNNPATSRNSQNALTANGLLTGFATGQTPEVVAAENAYNKFAKESPLTLSDVKNNPNVAAEVSAGRGQALGQTLSAEQGALAQGVQNALTGQSQQISAAGTAGSQALTGQGNQITAATNAANLTQPLGNTGYVLDPTTGQVVGPNGGSDVISTAVSNALQQVRNGADPTSSAVLGQLSSLGAPAINAFNSALNNGGGYNPTAVSASAQQTASQGAATGGEAYNLSTALKQVDTIKPVISNVLATSGIDPTDSRLMNAPIDTYISNIKNPEATAAYNLMLNDLQNFSSQIVSSGTALTPTGVTAATELQDPKGLSMNQIQYYFDTLQGLGNNRLSVLQSQAQKSGYTGYSGEPASPVSSTPVAPQASTPGSEINNPAGQFAAGVGINGASALWNGLSDIKGEILGFLTKGLMSL